MSETFPNYDANKRRSPDEISAPTFRTGAYPVAVKDQPKINGPCFFDGGEERCFNCADCKESVS